MIHLSNHLPSDGSDAGPSLRALLAANPNETFNVDGDWTVTSRHGAGQALVLEQGQRLVSEMGGRLVYDQAQDPAHRPGETFRMFQNRADASGIELRGIRLAHRVEEISKKQSHCLFFYNNATDVVVENVTIEEVGGGDGAYFGNGCDRVRVEDCTVRNFMRHGIVVAGSGTGRRGFLIRNNATESDEGYAHRYRPGVNIETTTPTATIEYVRVVGNRCEGSIGANYSNGEITGNQCRSMSLSRSRGVLVAHNVICYTNDIGWAVKFVRYQECRFTDNVVETAANGVHIEGMANGGAQWHEAHPAAALTGSGNRVLLRDPARIAFKRARLDPADSLETPQTWQAAP